jgi:hypothetical protein
MSCCSYSCWIPEFKKTPTTLVINKTVLGFTGFDDTFVYQINPPIGPASITTLGGVGSFTTSNVTVGQTYSITEQLPPFWILISGPTSFTIAPGTNSITFVNTLI